MPFTPFHLGPGAAFKAIGGRHFSFLVFGGSQVLMDIEPLVRILRNDAVLHGYTHTLAGALAIGGLAAVTGKPISEWVLRKRMTWTAACAGAFIGTFSHIVFDAVMHADMRPWWPLANGNGLLHAIDIEQLHMACLALGLLGLAGIAARALFRREVASST